MKNKKMINRIVRTVLVLIVISLIVCGRVYGSPLSGFDGTIKGGSEARKGITTLLGTVLTGIRIAGSGIAIIILSYVGIKYMLASASERAEIKNYMIKYVIGAIILFSATYIVTELVKIAQQITKT